MDASDLAPLIELLDENIDDLEEALGPLLDTPLSNTASKLPLLDKAQLYVLVTYAIESILFCNLCDFFYGNILTPQAYLRLNGTNAKEHPVFRELTRVKQYFEKIKIAESAGAKPNTQLDKAAAGRFIKHALAGNDKYGQALASQQKKADNAAHAKGQERLKKRKYSSPSEAASNDASGTSRSDSEPTRTPKVAEGGSMSQDQADASSKLVLATAPNVDDSVQHTEHEARGEKKRQRKDKRKRQKQQSAATSQLPIPG